MYPNRVVAVATAVLTLALGVLPVVADMDWTSTAGILAGVVAVLGVALKWLDGWQKHEARTAPELWVPPTVPGDTPLEPLATSGLIQPVDVDEDEGDEEAPNTAPVTKDPPKDKGDVGRPSA